VREEVASVVEHHGIFQTYDYGHHYGWGRDARDRFRTEPYWQICADFCDAETRKASTRSTRRTRSTASPTRSMRSLRSRPTIHRCSPRTS
jgi:hypothetical protein